MLELLFSANALAFFLAEAITLPLRLIAAEIHFQLIDAVLTIMGI